MEPDQLPASAPLWSSNSFRSLLLNAIDVVVIVGPDSAIQYASPGVEREFGYRTQELIGVTRFNASCNCLVADDDAGRAVAVHIPAIEQASKPSP